MKLAFTIFIVLLVASDASAQSECYRQLEGLKLGMSVEQVREMYPVLRLVQSTRTQQTVVVMPADMPTEASHIRAAGLRFLANRLYVVSVMYDRSASSDSLAAWSAGVCKTDISYFEFDGSHYYGHLADGSVIERLGKRGRGAPSTLKKILGGTLKTLPTGKTGKP